MFRRSSMFSVLAISAVLAAPCAADEPKPFSHRFWDVAQQSWQKQTTNPDRPNGERLDLTKTWDQRVALVHIEHWIQPLKQPRRNIPAEDLAAFVPDVIRLLQQKDDLQLSEQAAHTLGMLGVKTPAVRDALIAAAGRKFDAAADIPGAVRDRGIREEIDAWDVYALDARKQALASLGQAFPRDVKALTTLAAALDKNTLESFAAAKGLSYADLSVLKDLPKEQSQPITRPILAWLNTPVDGMTAKLPIDPQDREAERGFEGLYGNVQDAKLNLLQAACKEGADKVCGGLDAQGIYRDRKNLVPEAGPDWAIKPEKERMQALMTQLRKQYGLKDE